MWHCLKLKSKQWLWGAVYSHYGRLINWVFGNRNQETLIKLMERLRIHMSCILCYYFDAQTGDITNSWL